MPPRRPTGGNNGAGVSSGGCSINGIGASTSANGPNSGGTSSRRKRSLGNLRRAHPASGATWNVQVVRGKMSSKCLWHACRALVLGLTLMLLGAGMATIGYYADYLSMGVETRGNATVRVKNDLKGFHLNNFSYVGPIVMGFGGFIVVASCVMTFEARDSAAKVVPARLRATGGSKATVRSNQSSSASQRRALGLQFQTNRWDQQFGVFRASPAGEQQQQQHPTPFDRDALTAELIKFSKSLSASARFSPQLQRLTYTGSVPNLSTHASNHPLAYFTNISHLLSPNHKTLLLENQKRNHRHHQHRHHHHHHHHQRHHHSHTSSSGRQMKTRGTRISNSLIQRTTRENAAVCALLQPPAVSGNRLLWHAASFDESGRLEREFLRNIERTKRSDTAKRHVLSRQKPIEHEEDKCSPLGNRRSSTMSDSSYSGRWTARCASIASHASSIDSRRVQVDLHSPEVVPKSILRSPKRYNSGPSATPSVEREFRSQLSVCSEPPPMTVRQLSGQSSIEPCLPEETCDSPESNIMTNFHDDNSPTSSQISGKTDPNTRSQDEICNSNHNTKKHGILKKPRPDSLLISPSAGLAILAAKPTCEPNTVETSASSSTTSTSKATIINNRKAMQQQQKLHRSNSSRTFYRPKQQVPREHDDSVFYIKSAIERATRTCEGEATSTATTITTATANIIQGNLNEFYDSLQVINERRSTLLRVESETALNERKTTSFSLLQNIPERQAESQSQSTSIEIEEIPPTVQGTVSSSEGAIQQQINEDRCRETDDQTDESNRNVENDVKLNIGEEIESNSKTN